MILASARLLFVTVTYAGSTLFLGVLEKIGRKKLETMGKGGVTLTHPRKNKLGPERGQVRPSEAKRGQVRQKQGQVRPKRDHKKGCHDCSHPTEKNQVSLAGGGRI